MLGVKTLIHYFLSKRAFLLGGLLCGWMSFVSQTSIIDSLENSLSGQHESKQRIETYTLLSRHLQLVDLAKSRNYAYLALEMSQKTEVNEFLGEIYGCLGDIAVIQDSLDIAKKHYERSLQLFEKTGGSNDLVGVTMVLGNIANVQNNLAEAMIYYKEAIKYAEESGLETWLDDLHLNIAILNSKAGKIEEAQNYLTIALELAQKTNDTLDIANAYDYIGLTYIQYNDTILAKDYLLKAMAIYALQAEYHKLSQTFIRLSLLERTKRNHQLALTFLDSAIFYLDKEEVTYSPKLTLLADISVEKGKNHAALGQDELARKYFAEAYNMGKRNRQLEVIAEASLGLSEFWLSKDTYDSAYLYHKIYKAYSDTLITEANIRELAYQDAQFKYDQQLALEKQEREKQEVREKRNMLVLSIVIVSLIFTLIILILFLKLGRNKVKRIGLEQKSLKNELEVRNKELNTHVIYQLKKNEFILDISKKLGHLVSNLKTENKKVVQDVIRQLDSDSSDDVWKEFEVRFQQVHTGFYKSLAKDFPELTTNDLRLSAFLRLNMNTKDIAAITYQSTNSIDVARSRLRQKFGLNKDENLSAFLSRY